MNLPEAAGDTGNGAARRETNGQSALVAAYREGLGLAAVAVIRDPAGIRIVAAAGADGALAAAADCAERRWWSRRLRDAERVAAAATVRWRRRQSQQGAATAELASSPARGDSSALLYAAESIARAAEALNVVLQTDEEIFTEAMTVIARVDAEIGKLQRSGGMKSINKSYRSYRIKAAARGERVIRYADWMSKYREKLVRELAAALRYA